MAYAKSLAYWLEAVVSAVVVELELELDAVEDELLAVELFVQAVSKMLEARARASIFSLKILSCLVQNYAHSTMKYGFFQFLSSIKSVSNSTI